MLSPFGPPPSPRKPDGFNPLFVEAAMLRLSHAFYLECAAQRFQSSLR